jgi:hypothetical protein
LTVPLHSRFPSPLPGVEYVSLLAVGTVRLWWRVQTPLWFAQTPSDTLWSALGAALRDLAPDVYEALVKTRLSEGGAPSPLIVVAEAPAGGFVPAGGVFAAQVLMLHHAHGHAVQMTQAAERVTSLGARRWQGFGSVRLVAAESTMVSVPALSAPVQELALHFETPVALKHAGAVARPSAALLLRRLAWRVRSFQILWNEWPLPLSLGDFLPQLEVADFRDLLASADGLESRFEGRRVRGHRYSASQSAARGVPVEVPTVGFLGTLTLGGPPETLAALWPLLATGHLIGVGKNAERGYGRYAFSPSTPLPR